MVLSSSDHLALHMPEGSSRTGAPLEVSLPACELWDWVPKIWSKLGDLWVFPWYAFLSVLVSPSATGSEWCAPHGALCSFHQCIGSG